MRSLRRPDGWDSGVDSRHSLTPRPLWDIDGYVVGGVSEPSGLAARGRSRHDFALGCHDVVTTTRRPVVDAAVILTHLTR